MRTDAPTPSTAERIRSVCLRAGHALLAVDGLAPLTTPVQHLLDDGTFAVAVPSAAAVPDGTAVMLELTDEAALPLRKPVRSLVWVRGELNAVPAAEVTELLDVIARTDPRPALLTVATPQSGPDAEHTLMRLETASVVVADAAGAESVDVATVVAATPIRSARWRHTGCATSTPPTRRWWPGWPPGCRHGGAAARSARWRWTATGCRCGSRTPTAITTSGCRFTGPPTIRAASARRCGC